MPLKMKRLLRYRHILIVLDIELHIIKEEIGVRATRIAIFKGNSIEEEPG